MTDLRKSSIDLLYELIEESNPGFTAKFPKGTLKFGAPAASSAGGGITNTRIPIRSATGGIAIGTGYLFYRRIELNKLFRGMSPRIDEYRPNTTMTRREMVGLINQRYGLNIEPADLTAADGTVAAEQSFGIEATTARQLCYVGSAGFTWYRGKRPMSDLVPASKRTLNGRVFPAGMSSYADFVTWIDKEYPNYKASTDFNLTSGSSGPFGYRADCYDSIQPVYGDPVGNWVRNDSNISNIVRMLMGSKAIADDNFANHRRIGISYGATVSRPSLPAATRNGVTSQEMTTTASAIPIVAVYYWDEINRRPMRWQNPNLAGTKAIPFMARSPLADERPRADLIGYGGDYSKWASKLSNTISWQEVADAMKEITGLPFSMDNYTVPFGLGNIPGGNFPRYTLPSAAVPEANSAKFNRVVLVTAPDSSCWWTGRFFLHYNA